MRPESIVNFERFYLGALVVGLINFVISWGSMQEMMTSDPAVAAAGLGTGFLVTTAGFSLLIPLILWYFIARRGSNIAKWILVVLFALGLVFTIPALLGSTPVPGGTIGLVLTLVTLAMQAYAVYMLFKPDAVAWLKGEGPVDPGAFN